MVENKLCFSIRGEFGVQMTFEAKEEIHRMRSEAERDVRERRGELQRQEKRLNQKEDYIDKKVENIERKEESITNKEHNLIEKGKELDKVIEREMAELEKISGYSVEEAKEILLANTEKALDETNTVVGKFMCQGKMPISVKERYLKMREQPQCPPNVEMLIENFDRALSHPDEHDLAALRERVREI